VAGVSEIGQTVSLAGTRCRSDGIGGGGIRDRSDGITSGYLMSVRRYRWRGIGDRSDGIGSAYPRPVGPLSSGGGYRPVVGLVSAGLGVVAEIGQTVSEVRIRDRSVRSVAVAG
jgi:hypothetical protein